MLPRAADRAGRVAKGAAADWRSGAVFARGDYDQLHLFIAMGTSGGRWARPFGGRNWLFRPFGTSVAGARIGGGWSSTTTAMPGRKNKKGGAIVRFGMSLRNIARRYGKTAPNLPTLVSLDGLSGGSEKVPG